MWDIELPNLQVTLAFGQALGSVARPGTVVGLSGDLGAGKTSFCQGVGLGLEIEQPIVSPTFILMSEYLDGHLPLLHSDVYRLHPGESEAIGLEEAVDEWEGLVLVEWAEKVSEIFPTDHLWVELTHLDAGRRASVRSTGPMHAQILGAWRDSFER